MCEQHDVFGVHEAGRQVGVLKGRKSDAASLLQMQVGARVMGVGLPVPVIGKQLNAAFQPE